MFKNCNIHFLKQLVSELKIEILPPKCTLIADDYTSRDIYFIRRGVCLEMNKKGIKIKSVLIIMNFVSPKGFVVSGECAVSGVQPLFFFPKLDGLIFLNATV